MPEIIASPPVLPRYSLFLDQQSRNINGFILIRFPSRARRAREFCAARSRASGARPSRPGDAHFAVCCRNVAVRPLLSRCYLAVISLLSRCYRRCYLAVIALLLRCLTLCEMADFPGFSVE